MNEIVTYSNNVTKLTTEIKVIQDNVCQGMIEIGKRLIEIKKELGHGQWLNYLDKELGYSDRTAQRLIKVANEFGGLNTTTSSYLKSSQVMELLALSQDDRNNFTSTVSVNDLTVNQLREEIKKYKEENGLLSEKQRKALEEKRRLEQELQREKSKPAKVETRVEYKEKIVDKTDYSAIEKTKQLEKLVEQLRADNNSIKNNLSMTEQLLANYKVDSEEYRKLKLQMSKLQVEMDGNAQKTVSVIRLTELANEIEFFLFDKLAPTKYKDFMGVLNDDDVVKNNFIHTIELVGDWYREMKTYIGENNYDNIITVEVN